MEQCNSYVFGAEIIAEETANMMDLTNNIDSHLHCDQHLKKIKKTSAQEVLN